MIPKVAFVLTVYNKEAWIAQTLKTILDQTLKEIEVIVYNDGSTDHSMEIVRLFAKKDNRIKIYGSKVNRGIAKAYNSVSCRITAPVVCISSADDLYDKFRAQRSYDYFLKHPYVKIIYGHYWRISAAGKILEDHRCPGYNKEDLFLPNNQYIPHGFMSVRKEVIEEVPYDEKLKYGIDYPWIKALANKYEPKCFARVNTYFGFYRWFGSNVSHQHRQEIEEQGNA